MAVDTNTRITGTEVLKSLPLDAQQQIRRWGRADDRDPVVRRANLWTQLKIAAIYIAFALSLIIYLWTDGHWAVSVASVAVLGMIALPLLRLFMHTQAHWKVGNGPVRNWLLDHGVSVLLSTPQTGYEYGHLAHHRYDNDFDPRGFPRDLQSTYIFSKNGKPSNIAVWCLFYIVVYQNFIHLYHVLNAPRRREVAWYAVEFALIVACHVALYRVSAGFYRGVYLPSLLLAWAVSAVTLYMMHAVDLSCFCIHPTLNTRHRAFNLLGDNGGYHLEHSLYPNVHQVFLEKASALIQPPEHQVLDGTYATEALRRLFGGRRRPAAPPAGSARFCKRGGSEAGRTVGASDRVE
jgi:fatty acid desaturase